MTDVDTSEAARVTGERLCEGWWPRFRPWLANHMNDPVLALEAAFMDGARAVLKLVAAKDEGVLVQIIGAEPCEPPTPSPPRADPSSASASPKRPRRRPQFDKCL